MTFLTNNSPNHLQKASVTLDMDGHRSILAINSRGKKKQNQADFPEGTLRAVFTRRLSRTLGA
jgi:hypothetical protein